MKNMTRIIWTENNTLFVKHNFTTETLKYLYEYEKWFLNNFNLNIQGGQIGVHIKLTLLYKDFNTITTTFKLSFGGMKKLNYIQKPHITYYKNKQLKICSVLQRRGYIEIITQHMVDMI